MSNDDGLSFEDACAFGDLELVFADKAIRVHRTHLVLSSSVLRDMLTGGEGEAGPAIKRRRAGGTSELPCLPMPGESCETWLEMLKGLHVMQQGGRVELTLDAAVAILPTAHKFNMTPMLRCCMAAVEAQSCSSFDDSRLLQLLSLGLRLHYDPLVKALTRHLQRKGAAQVMRRVACSEARSTALKELGPETMMCFMSIVMGASARLKGLCAPDLSKPARLSKKLLIGSNYADTQCLGFHSGRLFFASGEQVDDNVIESPDETLEFIEVLDAESGASVGRLRHMRPYDGEEPPSCFFRALAVTPDGRTAMTGDTDGFFRTWDCGAWAEVRCQRIINEGLVSSVALLCDGTHCVTATNAGGLSLLDVELGRKVAGNFPGHGALLAPVPGAPLVFSFRDSSHDFYPRIKLWDCRQGLRLAREWHVGPSMHIAGAAAAGRRVQAAVALDTGRKVLTGCDDGLLRLWEVSSGLCIASSAPLLGDDAAAPAAAAGSAAVGPPPVRALVADEAGTCAISMHSCDDTDLVRQRGSRLELGAWDLRLGLQLTPVARAHDPKRWPTALVSGCAELSAVAVVSRDLNSRDAFFEVW